MTTDSTKTCGFRMRRNPDGSEDVQTFELVWAHLPARIATQIAGALAGTSVMARVMEETSTQVSPRAIARLACDIAQQLCNEYREREWLLDLPPPTQPPTGDYP